MPGLPTNAPGNPTVALVNVSVGIDGLVTATYADGSDEVLGKVAMASFTAQALTEMIEASRSWDVQLKMIGDARDLDTATAELMQLPQ